MKNYELAYNTRYMTSFPFESRTCMANVDAETVFYFPGLDPDLDLSFNLAFLFSNQAWYMVFSSSLLLLLSSVFRYCRCFRRRRRRCRRRHRRRCRCHHMEVKM